MQLNAADTGDIAVVAVFIHPLVSIKAACSGCWALIDKKKKNDFIQAHHDWSAMIHACSARRSQRAASIHKKNLHFTTSDPRISAIKNDLIVILREYEYKIQLRFFFQVAGGLTAARFRDKELIFFLLLLLLFRCSLRSFCLCPLSGHLLFPSLCLVLHLLHASPALRCSLLCAKGGGDESPTCIVLMSKLERRRFEKDPVGIQSKDQDRFEISKFRLLHRSGPGRRWVYFFSLRET